LNLQAAIGWLELGDWRKADEHLEKITPQSRAHSDVLQVRVKIYAAAGKWDYVSEVASSLCTMLRSELWPGASGHALRQLDRTEGSQGRVAGHSRQVSRRMADLLFTGLLLLQTW